MLNTVWLNPDEKRFINRLQKRDRKKLIGYAEGLHYRVKFGRMSRERVIADCILALIK